MAGCVVLCAVFAGVFVGFVGAGVVDTNILNDKTNPGDPRNLWALIVAGSNGYFNYRHQADACHAFQILKKHGVPEEQIVVMMYDDIAHSEENPTPGMIINHPNGSDVYQGVPHDYIKSDVTPQNFLNILQGNQAAMSGIGTGKVIQSGPNDRIFVYFTDHGAPGLVAFPSDELYAKDFIPVLQNMYENRKYEQMVIYLEACESGSMFKKLLPRNIDVYATTAANSHESSYACYYDNLRETYLGDWYSVRWMEDSDVENLQKESLHKQFKLVKQEVNTSHVQQFGNLTIAKEHVSLFQGNKKSPPSAPLPKVPLDLVPSGDVPLAILQRRLDAARTEVRRQQLRLQLQQLTKNRDQIERTMEAIVTMIVKDREQAGRILTGHMDLEDYSCYESAVRYFDQQCFDLSQNEYALRHLYKLVNLCEEGITYATIKKAMYQAC